MTDRDLLEDAAKAAGMTVLRSRLDDPMWRDMLIDCRPAFPQTMGWNPLTDDGDAFRLAVALRIDVLFDGRDSPNAHVEAVLNEPGREVQPWAHEPMKPDPAAATRRAIVRAAAALAKDTA